MNNVDGGLRMLEAVQYTIETLVEETSDGFLPSALFHPAVAPPREQHNSSSGVAEHESAVKSATSSALARFVKGFALALALFAGVSAAPRPVAAETPAEFINILGTDVLAEMRSYASLDQKEAYFRQMLSQDADLEGISRFVLGPSWRVASPEQRQEFENLLQDYIMRADGPKLVQYSGGTFRVTGSRTDPAGVIVTSQITSPQGQPIEMDWQLGIADGRYKIEDLTIDGVSVALTRRSQIQTMMEQAGGQVGTLLATMRQQG
jgi:phospholipid transport system substrate-binding protein